MNYKFRVDKQGNLAILYTKREETEHGERFTEGVFSVPADQVPELRRVIDNGIMENLVGLYSQLWEAQNTFVSPTQPWSQVISRWHTSPSRFYGQAGGFTGFPQGGRLAGQVHSQ